MTHVLEDKVVNVSLYTIPSTLNTFSFNKLKRFYARNVIVFQ